MTQQLHSCLKELKAYTHIKTCPKMFTSITHNKQAKSIQSQVWQNTRVIPALRRLRQEDLEFEASLSYTPEPVSKF
jgi:hypothetical protein